ncbi:ADP-ribose pyrophosphatase YjhB, NUDIX family [Saccharicrinis carchari]|uniref:ADP-ribose pyrophosphatase YjhB, NUDIX family n=1 Tax=Saccharicrinis carchari TaxID=1168039 RepID=A0A521BHM9_SACCC|nr:NUDIX domain-containing protein [Saccharicrinis carchari]SMO46549.1 ADP-ribose pyrophosphatase YjhB, NUDIX family [Saccharicrinis carchari]
MTKPERVLKYCPRCGSKRFNFQGVHSFLCDNCELHYFINSSAAVAALIENEKGELLLTVRAFEPHKGMLDLPGGFVDINETVEDAVTREIKEELNLDVTEVKFIASCPNEYVYSGYSVYTCDMGFLCSVSGWENLLVQDDVTGIELVSRENIDWDKIGAESIKKIIRAYWNG